MLKFIKSLFASKTAPIDFQYVQEAQKVLSSIPDINAGGCGIAAYATFLYLKSKKQSVRNFQVVLLDDDLRENNLEFIKSQKVSPSPSYHITFKVNDSKILYDATGKCLTRLAYQTEIPTELTEKYFKQVLRDSRWNPQFERDTWIPIIEQQLNIKIKL